MRDIQQKVITESSDDDFEPLRKKAKPQFNTWSVKAGKELFHLLDEKIT